MTEKKALPTGSIGIYVGEMIDGDIQGLTASGFDKGMVIGKVARTKFKDIEVISTSALKIKAELQKTLADVAASDCLKKEIIMQVESISKSATQAEASDKYTKLMASLANHATVATAVGPILAKLAEQIFS